ncbi:MAG: FHA domain-containing protein [Gemmataceae bacterium]|nr:FHA domain-containing protein [Gemmataceae bacterium]
MEVKLIVASGKAKGRVVPLPSTVVMIGRGAKCHLRPHCPLVSKLHCAIARWAGKVVVRDLKSCNGTFINGERIHGEVRVHDGDHLRIGALEFTIHIQATIEEALPVQVVHPSEVKWLMDSQEGPAALTSSDTCADLEWDELFQSSGESKFNFGDTAELSAGDYLREYFRKRP